MRPAFGKFQAGAGDEVGDNARNKDFAGLRLRHNSGCSVNCDSADIATSDFNFTRMDTRAKRQADLFRGGCERQSAANAAAWSIERRQNAISR